MSISLSSFSVGQSAYVGQLNNNNTLIQNAINSLEAQVAAGGGGGGGTGTGFGQVWISTGFVGYSSFQVTLISNTHLSLTSGAIWAIDTLTLGTQTAAQSLNFVGRSSGTYQIIFDANGAVVISSTSAPNTGYQIVWNNPGFGSAERFLPILFHGDDYARMLSSVNFGSHTRIADRLSTIESTITLDTMYAQLRVSGLTWDFKAGQVRNNNQIFSAASGTITLPASGTAYVEVDPSTGVVSFASGGGFTSGNIPLRVITTVANAVTSNSDSRTWAVAAVSGGTGALTVSGTPEAFWMLNTDLASVAPTSNAGISVRRGTSATVDLRWNETVDQWQFTNDGTAYYPIQSLNLNPGIQQQSRFTILASGPTIISESNRSPTSGPPYESLNFASYVSTTAFAAVIRGYVLDSNPFTVSPTAGVQFFVESATSAPVTVSKLYATYESAPQPQMMIIPISGGSCVYNVLASSNFSFTWTLGLVGYFDYITGVGTQRVCGTQTGISIAGSAGSGMNIIAPFGAVMNRGIVYQLTTSANTGAGALYDVELYNGSGMSAGGLLFQATNIDASAAYTTRLPFMYEDLESTANIHLRISNNNAATGTFSLLLVAERFA